MTRSMDHNLKNVLKGLRCNLRVATEIEPESLHSTIMVNSANRVMSKMSSYS
jgi:hypothetical protein